MAINRSTITVCDNCGSSASTTSYKVEFGEGASRRVLRFDACGVCEEGVPLTQWHQAGRFTTGRGGRMHVPPVLSVDEVEALAERRRSESRGDRK